MVRRLALALVVALAVVAVAPLARATEVQRVVSPGGIEAWLVEAHAVPLVSLAIAFRGGAALDPAGRPGVANMVSGLLDEGAGKLDSATFQRRLADNAIRLGFDVGHDTFSGSLATLSENTEMAFGLFRLALTAPRFDPKPVARVRDQIQVGIARSAEDPGDTAGRAWFAEVFPDHPYGRPVMGTKESVALITVADLRAYVAAEIARDRMVIGVVGDITPEALAPLLDRTFGALPATAAPLDIPNVVPAAAGRTTVIQRDIPQSVVLFGKKGLARHDPDFYAAFVMNRIFGGGGFTSRLTAEVREKRGLAYGVYTYLAPLDHAALYLGRVATRNARVGESLAVIRAEMTRMRDSGATAAELADAKTYLTGSFPLRFDSNHRIAGFLVSMQLDDLGIDYIDRRNGLIEAVTLADVNRVAKRLLDPAALTVVVVGKPDGVTPSQ